MPDQALPLADPDETEEVPSMGVQEKQDHVGEHTINVSAAQRKLMNR